MIVPTVFVFVIIVRVPSLVFRFVRLTEISITIIGNTVNAAPLDFLKLFLDFQNTNEASRERLFVALPYCFVLTCDWP